MVGNKTANIITKVSTNSWQIIQLKRKFLKKDISRKKTKIIDDPRENNNIIMEYQKIINLLDNMPNQPSQFRIKNWVEINNDSRGTYNTNNQIKFKTSVQKSSLCY